MTDPNPALPVLGTLPSSWRIVSFGSVLLGGTRNGIYKPKQHHGSGAKIVNMGELFAHRRLHAVAMKRLQVTPDELGRFGLQEGDLIFARRSLVAEGAGKCSLVCEVDEPTVFESSIIRARPNPETADSAFLFYLFSSAYGSHAMSAITRQVAVAGITGRDLAALLIPLPPLTEQHRIARILGALEDKIELNRRMNHTLEAIPRAIFRSWFVDFDPVRKKMEGGEVGLPADLAALFPASLDDSEIGPVPAAWESGSLADVAALNSETWSKSTRPDVLQYVDLSNTKWGRIEARTTYARRDAPSRAQRVLRSGDTIVGTVRPGNGSYAYISEDGLTGSTGFASVRPFEANYREFVYLAATAPDNIASLALLADGAAYPAVRSEAVTATPVALAPHDVMARFAQISAPLFERMAYNNRESDLLTTLRDGLRPRLISGQLTMQGAERVAQ